MTSRLTGIELEGFRGFGEARRLDLDADAVIIRGDNGAGKTSLVDGVLWVFSGGLTHLVERVRGMRRVEDVVTNRYRSGHARVTLDVALEDVRWSFTRQGNQKSAWLEATRDGKPVADPEAALAGVFGHGDLGSAVDAVTTWGLLRQDAVRAALDTAGVSLHERLSSILGLERVSKFAAATTSASNALIAERTTARQSNARLAERHRVAVQRRDEAAAAAADAEARSGIVRAGLSEIAAALPDGIQFRYEDRPADLETIKALGAALAPLGPAIAAVASEAARLPPSEGVHDRGIADAERELAEAEAAATRATTQVPARTQLAAAAVELLGDTCPVCEQEIDQESVRAHLAEMIAENRRLADAAEATAAAVARARTALAQASERARLRDAVAEDVRVAFGAALKAARGAVEAGVEVDEQALASSTVATGVTDAVAGLRNLYRQVQEAGNEHVARLQSEAEAIERELVQSAKVVDEYERRCAAAKTLERAAHASAESIVARALQQLAPTFAEVFERLAPNPAFTELHARQDVFRNRNQIVPVVRDSQRGIEANPLLIFSEGQLNVVALSYFLGMALNAREGALPFLVLDDPLQALDVLAILGFSDLCRRIRDTRQLIVTTHDRRFADVLVRKLAPRERQTRTIVHDFTGWTREGPSVESRESELAEIIPLVARRAS